MSKSIQVSKSFGGLSLHQNQNIRTGSSSATTPHLVPTPVVLADASATLTVAQVQAGILVITPTASRNLTTPTAVQLVASLKHVGDSVDVSVINLGATTINAVVVAGVGITTVGSLTVKSPADDVGGSSGRFRFYATNVTSGSEAVSVYRV